MLRARLARMRTELAQARVRLEELEDQHRFDEQRFRVFEAERTGLRDALSAHQRQAEQRARDTARAHARELEERLEPLRARVEALTEQRDELAAKVDQLVADNAEHERIGEELRVSDREREALALESQERIQALEADLATACARVDALHNQACRARAPAHGAGHRARRSHLSRGCHRRGRRQARRAARAGRRRPTSAEVQAQVAEDEHPAQQVAEQRALVRHLTRTQATLDARTEQLGKLLASRWYRIVRSGWQARRRRPPLVSLGLLVLAAAGVALGIVLASTVATVVASLLGAVVIGELAVAYAVLVPALRDERTPRMAGQGTFASELPGERTLVGGLLARLETTPTSELTRPEPGPSPAVGTFTAARPTTATRLVPAAATGGHAERTAWIGATRILALSHSRWPACSAVSRACFAPECQLNCEFTIEDWRERLEADPPHLLLVESAWSGNRGAGSTASLPTHTPSTEACPPCGRSPLGVASAGSPRCSGTRRTRSTSSGSRMPRCVDHVFTTDANMIAAYEDLRGEHVRSIASLQFAAQPRLHNPVAITGQRRREPMFAGTYYRNRHRDRRASLEMLLDAARPHGLIIYDRTFGTTSDEYGFPERFLPSSRAHFPMRT